MKVSSISIALFLLFYFNVQHVVSQSETFVPHGKPIVKVFSDFSTHINNGKTQSGFQISRAYFGYNYQLSQHISGQVVFDVANQGGLQPSAFTALLKNAYAKYDNERFVASFGMIGTTAFNLSEKLWGKRYLYKSMQDEYGFSSSADLGATVSYQFIPQLSVDISVFNGEGYKKVQMDNVLQFAAGITLNPTNDLYVRLYGDMMKAVATQNTLSAVVGYEGPKASVAAEYSYQQANKMIDQRDFTGISVFGTLALAKKISFFARFDHLQSTKIGVASLPWNLSDGQVYIAGLEYNPIKGIKLAPNFRQVDYANGRAVSQIFVNLEMSW